MEQDELKKQAKQGLRMLQKVATSMTYILPFACYEIIRLNQRFCEILLVNVLREVKNMLTFLFALKLLFKPSFSRKLYRRWSCCPTTSLITLEFF